MSATTTCPNCSQQVVPTSEGTCPACRRNMLQPANEPAPQDTTPGRHDGQFRLILTLALCGLIGILVAAPFVYPYLPISRSVRVPTDEADAFMGLDRAGVAKVCEEEGYPHRFDHATRTSTVVVDTDEATWIVEVSYDGAGVASEYTLELTE